MADQDNVLQLKRLVAKMTNKSVDKIEGYTIADVLEQVHLNYSNGGGGGSAIGISNVTLHVRSGCSIESGYIELTNGNKVDINISYITPLTLTSVEGSARTLTVITVAETLGSNNHYMYLVGGEIPTPAYGQDLSDWTEWNGTDEITATNGHVVRVAECDANNRAIKCGECIAKSPVF